MERLNGSMGLNIGLNELAHVYDLLTFMKSRFLLNFKVHESPLILKSMHNDGGWK